MTPIVMHFLLGNITRFPKYPPSLDLTSEKVLPSKPSSSPYCKRFPIIIKEIFLHKFLVRSDNNPKSARVYVVSVFKISFIFHVLKNLFFHTVFN